MKLVNLFILYLIDKKSNIANNRLMNRIQKLSAGISLINKKNKKITEIADKTILKLTE